MSVPKRAHSSQELIPVLATPRQPRHPDAEDQPDMIERHFAEQTLKTSAPFRGRAGDAQVVINDQDALARPTQTLGGVGEAVLQLGRFVIVLHLVQARLQDVHDRQAFKTPALDFVRRHDRRRAVGFITCPPLAVAQAVLHHPAEEGDEGLPPVRRQALPEAGRRLRVRCGRGVPWNLVAGGVGVARFGSAGDLASLFDPSRLPQ